MFSISPRHVVPQITLKWRIIFTRDIICSLDHRSCGRNIEKANRDGQVHFIALCCLTGGAVASWLVRSLTCDHHPPSLYLGAGTEVMRSPDSGASGPGSSPGRGHCVVPRHFTLIVPLSTQVYKWVLLNSMLGEPCDELASYSGRSRDTPS